MSHLLLAAESASFMSSLYADWKHITFHEPAHYIFEFQNELLVFLIAGPLWQRAKRKAVARAIRRHDAEYHPGPHVRKPKHVPVKMVTDDDQWELFAIYEGDKEFDGRFNEWLVAKGYAVVDNDAKPVVG